MASKASVEQASDRAALIKQLEAALFETTKQFEYLDEDDVGYTETLERREQLEELLEGVKKMGSSADSDEVDIREDWSKDDETLYLSKTGRRIAHTASWAQPESAHVATVDNTEVAPPVLGKVVERKVRKDKIEDPADRILHADMERLAISKEGVIRHDNSEETIRP